MKYIFALVVLIAPLGLAWGLHQCETTVSGHVNEGDTELGAYARHPHKQNMLRQRYRSSCRPTND